MAIEPDESLYDLLDLLPCHSDTLSKCENNDPAAEVLVIGSSIAHQDFPVVEAKAVVCRTATTSTTRKLSLRNREKSCSAGMNKLSRPPSLGRLPRLGLWRLHA